MRLIKATTATAKLEEETTSYTDKTQTLDYKKSAELQIQGILSTLFVHTVVIVVQV